MPVGVTTRKKTSPIIIGETNFPRKIPNLNHKILSGVKNLEFDNPNIKNIMDKIIDHILIPSAFINGYKPTIKKNIQKTIPKLLLEPTVILVIKLTIL